MELTQSTLGEISRVLGAELHGDPATRIDHVRPLLRAGAGDLTFLLDGRPPPPKEEISASAVIVGRDVDRKQFPERTALLRVDNAYVGFAQALDHLYPATPPPFSGIDPSAHLDPSAELGDDVRIAADVVVGAAVRMGHGVTVYAGVVVGPDCDLGDGVILYPRVVLYRGCRIGARTVIHAGTVIGSDGFGYVPGPAGALKIRHLGGVKIGRDVEIGANCTIDRGVLEDSVIGNSTKIDNLVHLGHNVVVGDDCLIAAQTGMAGSCQIGERVTIAGQVGLAGHLKVGDNATIGAKSGVHQDLPADGQYLGYPAVDARMARKTYVLLHRIPDIKRQLDALEIQLRKLKEDRETP